jgi:hypothetical protein
MGIRLATPRPRPIEAITIARSLLSMVVLLSTGAAVAATQVDIDTLSEDIRSTGTRIVTRNDCEKTLFSYYQFEDKKIDELTLCTNTLNMKDLDQVWEAYAHEVTHIIQACDQSGMGQAFEDAYFPRIYRELQQLNPSSLEDTALYGSWSKRQEIEARYMELQPPGDVIDFFRSSQCFQQPGAQPSRR